MRILRAGQLANAADQHHIRQRLKKRASGNAKKAV
jgi:hypothetical protein